MIECRMKTFDIRDGEINDVHDAGRFKVERFVTSDILKTLTETDMIYQGTYLAVQETESEITFKNPKTGRPMFGVEVLQ